MSTFWLGSVDPSNHYRLLAMPIISEVTYLLWKCNRINYALEKQSKNLFCTSHNDLFLIVLFFVCANMVTLIFPTPRICRTT